MGESSETSAQNACFRTTQWTQVLQACEGGADEAGQRALRNLCLKYWYPLYAYARRKGAGPEDAEDHTQGFLAQLLGGHALSRVHPSKGRFRSFLLTCFDNFLRDQWDRETALKRGGGQTVLSLDWENAETRYAYEAVDKQTPATLFERAWALEVLARTLVRLRECCSEAGKGPLFQELKVFLTGNAEYGETQAVAAALGMTDGAVRVAITRLRAQYRDLLREEIAETVSGDPQVIEDEYRHVAEILRESA